MIIEVISVVYTIAALLAMTYDLFPSILALVYIDKIMWSHCTSVWNWPKKANGPHFFVYIEIYLQF
jgi:hypothetical protein